MKCKFCGMEVDEKQRFCPNCGLLILFILFKRRREKRKNLFRSIPTRVLSMKMRRRALFKKQ